MRTRCLRRKQCLLEMQACSSENAEPLRKTEFAAPSLLVNADSELTNTKSTSNADSYRFWRSDIA
jgi:hypothetical protein